MSAKVSVIIPVYNVQEYIRECVHSVMAQTFADLEILAVDDGSRDGSAAILKELAAEDSRIRILSKENGGLSDARNYGIAHAQGEFLAFIDGDDLADPGMIQLLAEAAQKDNADIAVSDMSYFYEDGHSSFSSGGEFSLGSVRENPDLIAINNSACNKLYRRSLFDDVSFPKGLWYEDLATVPILLYKAKRIVKVSQPLYRYRQRTGSIAHSEDRRIFDIYTAIDMVIRYVRAHGAEPQVLQQLQRLYVLHGLDLTTLRIKDFDRHEVRAEYLAENMRRLKQAYPEYEKDPGFRQAGFRKKLIFYLLKREKWDRVLKIYDR
jgi:glycosyltransferase involved in cell wall biosynthesis